MPGTMEDAKGWLLFFADSTSLSQCRPCLQGIQAESESKGSINNDTRQFAGQQRGIIVLALQVGDILEGKVTGIKPFGAFVALPESKTGLVHISEVSYEFVQDLATVLEAGQTVKVKVISIAPDGKIALSIKQTQPAPERAPRAPRSPRPQGQQGSNGGVRPAGGRPPRREAAPRVWQPKPSQPQGDLSFEDMMARYKTQSEEKIADLKRVTENHRGGYSRRRG